MARSRFSLALIWACCRSRSAILSEQHRHARDRLSREQAHQTQSLEKRLKARYGAKRDHAAREAAGLKARLSQKGLRGFVRKITGAQAKDSRAYQVQQQTLAEVRQAIAEHRHALVKRQAAERDSLHRDQAHQVKVQESKLAATERRKDALLRSGFMADYTTAIDATIDKAHGQQDAKDHTHHTHRQRRSRGRTHGLER